MNRLTLWDEYGNADIIAISDIMPEVYAGLGFEGVTALTDALNRLGTYEDTGFMPQEIRSLQGEWNAMRSVVDDYRALGTIQELREMREAILRFCRDIFPAAQPCASESCPYQTGEDCPAAGGCGGFEKLGGDGE